MGFCSYDSCRQQRAYTVKGKKAANCKQHAEDGMVRFNTKRRCSNALCAKRPSFPIEGSKVPAYCKQQAECGMVNVVSRRCSSDSCTRQSTFYIEGIKIAEYCKQHAADGMVDVVSKRCSHSSCTEQPSYVVLANGAATACASHKSDILGGPVINFKITCTIAKCGKVVGTRWEAAYPLPPSRPLAGRSCLHCQNV